MKKMDSNTFANPLVTTGVDLLGRRKSRGGLGVYSGL